MSGGRGSALGSMVAVITLVALVNGLSCFGAGYEVQLIASGLVLAFVVALDAIAARQRELVRGQRPELLRETAASREWMEEAR